MPDDRSEGAAEGAGGGEPGAEKAGTEERAAEERLLVEAIIFGDGDEREAAWLTVIGRYRERLRGAVRTIARGRGEEVVEEFFQHICSRGKLAAFLQGEASHLGAYLGTAVRNYAREELRKAKRQRKVAAEDAERRRCPVVAREKGLTEEPCRALRAALQSLPVARRVCYKLQHLGTCAIALTPEEEAWLEKRSGTSAGQIAAVLRETASPSAERLAELAGVTVASFYQHICRARRDLYERLAGGAEGGDDEL